MTLQNLDTPVLLIDIDGVEKNLDRMMAFAQKHRLMVRPHIKTHKTPELAHMQIEKGAAGITVASLGEAEVMADAGIMDIFMAYEIIGSAKLKRLAALMQRSVKLTSAVDSLTGARALSQAMTQNNLCHGVLIEVDTGQGRCGIKDPGNVLALAQAISALPGLRFKGIFTHEGQTYGVIEREKIRQIALKAGQTLVTMANYLDQNGFHCDTVSVGSTPAWNFTGTIPGITEIRPGTYIFNDRVQVACGAAGVTDCAATILATVISHPEANRIVIDAGSKTFSDARPAFLAGFGQVKHRPDLIVNWTNEEHGIIQGQAQELTIGDLVEIIPNHICTTVNMLDTMWLHQSGHNLTQVRIAARGRVQ